MNTLQKICMEMSIIIDKSENWNLHITVKTQRKLCAHAIKVEWSTSKNFQKLWEKFANMEYPENWFSPCLNIGV